MPGTINHVLTATTPDDPGYEIRPSHWNSAHAVTINAAGSEISGAFSNANGASFGLSGTALTLSYTVPSVAAFLTTAMLSNASSAFAGIGETTSTQAGTALGLTVDTAGVNIAYPNWLTTAQAPGAYLTTARASNDGVGLNTAQTNVTWTVNSSGISINAAGYAGTGTSATNATVTLNSNGLAISVAAPGAGGGAALKGSSTYTQNTGTVEFANSNGITFGLSNNGTMTASHNGLTTAMASNRGSDFVNATAAFAGTNASGTIASAGVSVSVAAPFRNFFAIGNTIPGYSTSLTYSSAVFAAAGPVSVGLTSDAGVVFAVNACGPGTNITTTAGTDLKATIDTNGLTIAHPAWLTTAQAPGAYLTTARASNDGVGLNTALTAGPLAWTVNSGGISLNAGSAAGTSTGFTGANISASITHNTAGIAISASVAAPGGGGYSAGVSNLGNTAGSTGVTGTRLVLVGANNISLSQSTDANGGTVSFSVAAPGGGAGITASMWPEIAMPIAVSSVYSGASNTTAGGSRTTVSLYVCPVVIPHDVSFNRVWGHLSMNTSAGTGSVTMGNAFGLYTLNGASLSLLTSWGMGFHLSQNSVSARSQQWYWGTNSTSNSSAVSGNVSASFARLNQVLYDTVPQSVAAGNYWLVHANTQRSSGLAAALFSYFPVSESQSTGGSMFGTNVSSRKYLHHGIASTNTTNTRSNNVGDILPPYIETSAITGTGGSSQLRSNIVYLHSATA